MNTRVLVVLLTHNQQELTCACLRSLEACSSEHDGVLLVDNASTDGTLECVRREFPGVETLRSESNTGVAGGRNLGIARALEMGADYVWVVDNDTQIPQGTITTLREYMQGHPGVGVAAATVCQGDDPGRVWSTGGKINWLLGEAHHPERGIPYASLCEQEVDAAFISGCNMFIRSSVLRECGPLDDRFFYYGEDVEFSRRVGRRGYRLASLRSPVIYHYHRSALGHVNPLRTYLVVRNRFLIMAAEPRWRRALFHICWRIQFYGRYLPKRLLARDFVSIRAALLGLRDYRRGNWTHSPDLP